MKMFFPNKKGFTLTEVLLVIAILVILIAVSAPLYLSFLANNDLSRATETIPFAVHYARIRSEGMFEGSEWSVHITEGAVTVFKGSNFTTRDTSKDVAYDFADSVTVTGSEDILLEKFTGLPQATYSTTLEGRNNKTKVITINEEGTVSIQ